MGTACQEPGAGLSRRPGGIGGVAEGTLAVPRAPERVGKQTEFPEVPPPFPALLSGRPLAGALAEIWEVTRGPGFRQKLGRGRRNTALTLQLLAFILLGLVFFEQAGEHGRVWLCVDTAGPSAQPWLARDGVT